MANDLKSRVFDVIGSIFDGLTVVKALKLHGVSVQKFYLTLEKYPELALKYAYAEKSNADLLVDEMLTIADNEENYGKARNQIDARKWIASKRAPKKYGDRIDVNVEGSIDLNAAIESATKRITNTIVDTAIPVNNTTSERNDDDALTITELLS